MAANKVLLLPLLPLLPLPRLLVLLTSAHASRLELNDVGHTVAWGVAPAAVKLQAWSEDLPRAFAGTEVNLAGQLGECEHVQLWVRSQSELANVTVTFGSLYSTTTGAAIAASGSALDRAGVLLPSAWGYRQQGYVYNNCSASGSGDQWNPCYGGWLPDPLLPPEPGVGIPRVLANFTQPLFLDICIPLNATPGNYSCKSDPTNAGCISVVGKIVDGGQFAIHVDAVVEVWPIKLPALNSAAAFSTIFSMGEGGGTNGTTRLCPQPSDVWCARHGDDTTSQPLGGGGLANFYPRWFQSGNAMRRQWFDSLAQHRTPADDLYLMDYRSLEEYQLLAASGAKWMNIAYVTCCPTNAGADCKQYTGNVCTNQTVAQWIDHLRPIVGNLTALGLVDQAYIYGFDEVPRKYALPAIDVLYGAFKQAFPRVRTVATLASHFPGEFDSLPLDLPLDIWVQAYNWPWSELQQGFAAWRRSGPSHGHPHRDAWWYWAGAPQTPTAINTFIQRPVLEARALFWLAARHGIRGMLYYSIDQWAARCGVPSSVNSHPLPCRNISRVRGTAMTDFVNTPMDGEGSWVYPGATGLVSSIRLEAITDGLEDAELFTRLGVDPTTYESNATDLIDQVFPGADGPDWNTTNWALKDILKPSAKVYEQLESVRRQAAHRIIDTQMV